MKYDYENTGYYGSVYLKQGYYNYVYAFLPNGSTTGDVSLTEGSHWETENDYVIYVYHKDMTSRYDKLIGFEIANSVIKN